MINIEKIFNNDKIQELKKQRLERLLSSSSIYKCLSKYGFNDGCDLSNDERLIIRELLVNVVSKLPKTGELELNVTDTIGHNPSFITFYHPQENEYYHIDDFDSQIQEGIYEMLLPIFEQEIELIKFRMNFPG